MSSLRRWRSQGRREREARKRHRRGSTWFSGWPSGTPPLKHGRKHGLRLARRDMIWQTPKREGEDGVMSGVRKASPAMEVIPTEVSG